MNSSSIKIAQNIKQFFADIKIPKYPPSNDFPFDVLKYMKANANPKQALKLMKLNKYFIQENCPFIYIGNNTFVSENGGIRTSNYTNEMIYKLPNNLGINGILRVHEDSTDIDTHIRLLFDKIIFFDLKCLILHVKKFKYDHFKTLISFGKLKELVLHDTIFISKNDEIIPYETLLDDLPSLRTLVMQVFRFSH
uniref:Uncharacterized protein n=1 Tax=Panagrolaimus davidi TaxID=227884 RepID=A0A914Q9P8_9BILA